MQDVVERRGGKPKFRNWMHARKCGEATGEPDMKSNDFKKFLRGTGEEV
jgi:hypothetical protein